MDSKPLRRCLVLLSAVAVCLVAVPTTGCASSSKQADDDNAEVGQPPSSDDPDSEPGEVPKGPSVDISDGGEGEPEDSAEATPASDTSPTVTPQQVETFMQKGPPYALTLTRVEAHRINGSFAGFEIIAMHPSAKRFMEPEVVVGDVITHINGVRMKKPDDYLSAWKLLDDVDAIRIKFTRDGDEREAVWRIVGAEGASESAETSSQ